ncbi:MAG: SRPBCC domain-containing protein, partial [Chitinophagales bacterium]
IKIESPYLLTYSVFDPFSTMEDIPQNYLHVTYKLSANNGTTLLTVTQGDYTTVAEGERRYNEAFNNGEGWNPILVAIKNLVEGK